MTTSKHLAFIHPFLFRYARGIERYTVNLAGGLADEGHQLDILTWAWPNPLHWSELSSQVHVRVMPTARYFAAWFAGPMLAWHLLRNKYDMVYLHFADYGEAFALNLLRLLGRQPPFTIVLHYPYSQVPHRYHSFVGSGLARQAQQVIAVSQFVADEAQPLFGRSAAVVSHGVDTERFCADADNRATIRHELGIGPDVPLLLTVSAFEERKGIQTVLRALPELLVSWPQLRYAIVGSGPYAPALQQLVQELGLHEQVIFVPSTPKVAPYFQAADLFMIPARGEASSLVSLEALACEVPVVASIHPPFDELIQPGWGRRVDETDTHALAAVVDELLRDEVQRRRMGRQGRDYVLAEHTWPMIARQYRALLG